MRPDPGAATRQLAPADALTGTLVADRFRVGAPLGRGGMGVVFHAEHAATGRKLALKVLGPQWALHREARGRFVAEARAANRIEHPDVVGVLDAGELPDGRPFIAMEYVDGESLLAAVKRGAITVDRALLVARAIADVLVAAHAKGVVHRDLKCDNVMLLRAADPSAPPRIKLLDFGLAAALRDDPSQRLTTPGIVMGTPAYMAPEQGRGAPATPGFDVYAIGVVLFEMLTRTTPFGDGDPLVVIATKLTRRAPSILAFRDDLPPAIVELVDECLALDPGERPPDMEAVRARLDAIVAPALPARPRQHRRVRPFAVHVAIGATALLALRLVVPRVAHGEPAVATEVPTVGESIPLSALAIVPDERPMLVAAIAPKTPPAPPVLVPSTIARPIPRPDPIDSAACQRTRARALDARAAHDWDGVLRNVERRACWGPMVERSRLQVLALAELQRFSECVVAGERSRDAQVQRTALLCKRRR